MATILTLPTSSTRGVIVFTTQDRDNYINFDLSLKDKLLKSKSEWVYGLHHNWHDHHFRYDPFFDFSMAGDGDLIEVSKKPFNRLDIDACNFTPSAFAAPGQPEKFWDILAIPRLAYFKRFPLLLETFSEMYKTGFKPRVLCITPVPKYDFWSRRTTIQDARERFEKLFPDKADRMRFTFLTLDHDHPFPLDLPTLGHFYRSSRAFVHFANDERRCRIAAYAWGAGIPVIGRECVGSILKPEFQIEPYFFKVDANDNYSEQIKKAIALTASSASLDFEPVRSQVMEVPSSLKMINWLHENFGVSADKENYFLSQLDIRLGRHHGYDSHPNMIGVNLNLLANWGKSRDLWAIACGVDPERTMEIKIFQSTNGPSKEPLAYQSKRTLLRIYQEFITFIRPAVRWGKQLVKRHAGT